MGDDGAADLVGRLIRSYRDDMRPNGRRLSQEGFLELMVARGEDYAGDLDRSTLSNWERGVRLAPREFLVAMGRACDIPEHDMDRLMNLAGYHGPGDERERGSMLAAARDIEHRVEILHRDVRSLMDSTDKADPSLGISAVVKGTLRKAAVPGVYALTVGFILSALGQNGTLVLLAYVFGVLALVLGQGVLRWVKSDRSLPEHENVVDLFYISLFFTMNVSLLASALTKTDNFGFHTFAAFANTPVSFLLTMLTYLALSLAGSVIFSVSWSRQYGPKGGRNTLLRALWTTLPPLAFVYIWLVVFTDVGYWIHITYVFGILFLAFTTIVAFNEPGMVLRNRGFVLIAAQVAIILGTLGVAGTLIGYWDPSLVMSAEDFRIVPLREVSTEALGYTEDESPARLRLGILWMSFATIVYMVVVVGGYVIMTLNRATSTDRHSHGSRESHRPA